MAAIKVHVYVGSDDGTESCDYRGDRFIGHEQGDEHRTVLEIDPATDEEVAEALEIGPVINRLLRRAVPSGPVADLIGRNVGVRVGVWDE